MTTLINPWELETILTCMRQGAYTPSEGEYRLARMGVPVELAHTFAFQIETTIEQLNELTALADKADEMHLMHMDVTWLIDLAYEHNLIGDHYALALLIQNGYPHESAELNLATTRKIRDRDASRAEFLEHPETHVRYCTVCGRQTAADNLSNRGLCQNCSAEIVTAVTFQLIKKSGPYYKAWRTGMMAYAYELEDEEIAEQHAIRDAEPPRKLSDYIEEPYRECDNDCANCAVPSCSLRHAEYAGPKTNADEPGYAPLPDEYGYDDDNPDDDNNDSPF